MLRKSIHNIQNLKSKRPITCLTAYSSPIAKIIDEYVDIILVGDSVGNTIYGMHNTRSVKLSMMINHGMAVVESSKKAFTIIDMPYNTYKNKDEALKNAKKLIKKTKCQSVKIETDISKISIVSYLVKNNITVISHIGILPQKYKNFKNIKRVGKDQSEMKKIFDLAVKLEKAGSSMIILECLESELAKKITKKLKIPTIGIGSSIFCDGQVLVIDDILNIDNTAKKPKFIKKYSNLNLVIKKAVGNFSSDVIKKKYPE